MKFFAKTINQLLGLLSASEKRQLAKIVFLTLGMAIVDALGIVSIMPFLALVANPEVIQSNAAIHSLYGLTRNFGIDDHAEFLFLSGSLVLILLILSLAFKAYVTYAQLQFAVSCESAFSTRLLRRYLDRPYTWLLTKNTAELAKTILSDVSAVVGYGISPAIQLFTQLTIAMVLIATLLYVEPKISFILLMGLSVLFYVLIKKVNSYLELAGERRVAANKDRFTVVSETFGSIKIMKFSALEAVYLRRFSTAALAYAGPQSASQLIAQLPRFALEAIAFGSLLSVLLFKLSTGAGLVEGLPVIALFALAGYRLLPALQQVYVSITNLKFVMPTVQALKSEFGEDEGSPDDGLRKQKNDRLSISIEDLHHSVLLEDVFLSYPGADRSALRGVNIAITANSRVGFVGRSGSGKTTTADAVMGLLPISSGAIRVDGVSIADIDEISWRQLIGYVPQTIFLIDDTITSNIALGVSPEKVDHALVEKAAKVAQLHDFVVNELPERYATSVGERGVKLSGGQIQRIGIARALYRRPRILILDEATSALDGATESALMRALKSAEGEMTIITITHRLTTIEECDTIYVFEAGSVRSAGTYEELRRNDSIFSELMANS